MVAQTTRLLLLMGRTLQVHTELSIAKSSTHRSTDERGGEGRGRERGGEGEGEGREGRGEGRERERGGEGRGGEGRAHH